MGSTYDYLDKFTFSCEWYNKDAQMVREMTLNFFPYDNAIEVFDVRRQEMFIKRMRYPELNLSKLQLGSTIQVFSRLFFIKDCSNDTKQKLFKSIQSTFALIKPMPAKYYGKVITAIIQKGFRIVQLKLTRLDKDFALLMYSGSTNSMLPLIIDYLTNGEVIGMELVAPNAVEAWSLAMGPTDPAEAPPGSLRKLFGLDKLKNAVHGSPNLELAQKVISQFFGSVNRSIRLPLHAQFKNSTCCIIKPHAITEGNLGAILEIITQSNFKITAMAMFSLDIVNAEEFYEVYNGVVPEFKSMAWQLAEGRCIALEIISKVPDVNVVCEFRKLCGPRDPDVCRQLYPESIRGRYGLDVVHNAVHCTDLPEDGVLEVEYFFKLLTLS